MSRRRLLLASGEERKRMRETPDTEVETDEVETEDEVGTVELDED